jgi:putative ABC transport system permease protein
MTAAIRLPLMLVVLLYQSIVLALSQIWANKMRGVLTTLGILIGVAAISAVIALIDGMKTRVVAEFEAFGANKLFINPRWRQSDIGRRGAWTKVVFKRNDFDDLLDNCPSIESFNRDAGYGGWPVAYHGHDAEEEVEVNAIDPAWHMIERRGTRYGRPMTELDSQRLRGVAVINTKLRDTLKLDRDPTGQIIDVYYFGHLTVIGLLDDPPAMGSWEMKEGRIMLPFMFATSRFNWPTWYSVTATAKSREHVEEAAAEVDFYLRQKRHLRPGEEANFSIDTAAHAIDQVNEVALTVTTVAGGIVAISLLVGGIGIMNIMLVSVSERTHEIGLRKAVGARPTAICMQFLVEAIVLCLFGGALGLLLGQGITSGVAAFLPDDPNQWVEINPKESDWNFDGPRNMMKIVLPPQAIAVAFIFSASVGVVFGFFPAIKAASLDPIEALRHE